MSLSVDSLPKPLTTCDRAVFFRARAVDSRNVHTKQFLTIQAGLDAVECRVRKHRRRHVGTPNDRHPLTRPYTTCGPWSVSSLWRSTEGTNISLRIALGLVCVFATLVSYLRIANSRLHSRFPGMTPLLLQKKRDVEGAAPSGVCDRIQTFHSPIPCSASANTHGS